MKAYIVTGTTRGIGRAIAKAAIECNAHLFSLSRSPDRVEPGWQNFACDLRQPESIRPVFERLMRKVPVETLSDLVLINNAGVLEPMGPVEEAGSGKIVDHLMVNQAAPAIMMSAFIGLTSEFHLRRRIINISSGAAVHPYAGWAMYCASKAAIDTMTLCIAAEQRAQPNPVAVCSVYPGKVETDMQRTVRNADPEKFPAQPKFVSAKAHGDLLTSGQVAKAIIEMDAAGAFENGCIYDLRSAVLEGETRNIRPIRTLPQG